MNPLDRRLAASILCSALLISACRTATVAPAPVTSPTVTSPTVAVATATTAPLQTPDTNLAPAAAEKTSDRFVLDIDAIERALEDLVNQEQFMGAVLIGRGGDILWAKGYGVANRSMGTPNSPDTAFRIGSLSKQFTAATILKYVEEGALELDAPLSAVLSTYPNGGRMTIHQLLTHSAGIPDYTRLPIYRPTMSQAVKLDDLLDRFQDLPLEFEPGASFSYSSSGYMVLTKVLEVVSGRSYTQTMAQEIFEPLDLENTGVETRRGLDLATGYLKQGGELREAPFIDMSIPVGAGAIYSSATDLHRWMRALTERTILGEESIDALFQPHVQNDGGPNQPPGAYGYGWIIDRDHERLRYSHSGDIAGFAAYLAYYPVQDLTVVFLSNVGTIPLPQVREELSALLFSP